VCRKQPPDVPDSPTVLLLSNVFGEKGAFYTNPLQTILFLLSRETKEVLIWSIGIAVSFCTAGMGVAGSDLSGVLFMTVPILLAFSDDNFWRTCFFLLHALGIGVLAKTPLLHAFALLLIGVDFIILILRSSRTTIPSPLPKRFQVKELPLGQKAEDVTSFDDRLNEAIRHLGQHEPNTAKAAKGASITDADERLKLLPMWDWSTDDVSRWLTLRGFAPEMVSCFKSMEVDGDILVTLTDRDLKEELNVEEFAMRRKVLIEIVKQLDVTGKFDSVQRW